MLVMMQADHARGPRGARQDFRTSDRALLEHPSRGHLISREIRQQSEAVICIRRPSLGAKGLRDVSFESRQAVRTSQSHSRIIFAVHDETSDNQGRLVEASLSSRILKPIVCCDVRLCLQSRRRLSHILHSHHGMFVAVQKLDLSGLRGHCFTWRIALLVLVLVFVSMQGSLLVPGARYACESVRPRSCVGLHAEHWLSAVPDTSAANHSLNCTLHTSELVTMPGR